jgi:hypothetical protein
MAAPADVGKQARHLAQTLLMVGLADARNFEEVVGEGH